MRQARKNKGWKQAELAERIGSQKQRISAIETGNYSPTIEMLAKLCTHLDELHHANLWVFSWLEQRLNQDGVEDEVQTFLKSVRDAGSQFTPAGTRWELGMPRSLEDFPTSFQPLTIVCGDRREIPPDSRGDLFAYPLAATDLMFLPSLGAMDRSTIIRTDKVFMDMSNEYLSRIFKDTNILFIGSPAVNYGTRIVNQESIFRFDLDPDLIAWMKDYRLAPELTDKLELDYFWKKVQQREGQQNLKVEDLKDLSNEKIEALDKYVERSMGMENTKSRMNRFRKPGILDPADDKVHGTSTRQLIDFGIISIARNPFATTAEFVCIIAAGIHGPGTAHAMRVLADGRNFKDRPFGGVLEITLDGFLDWPSRFERASWNWQTKPYTPKILFENFKSSLTGLGQQRGEAFLSMTDREIEQSLEFLGKIMGEETS